MEPEGTWSSPTRFPAGGNKERVMADSGGNSFLGFILGGVVVVLVIIAIVMFSGGFFGGGNTSTVRIEVPKVGTK
jgi:hypothetical protein